MKKIFISFFIISMLGACDVEVENPNALTVPTFWKTEADAQSGLNAVYNMFNKPEVYSRWVWFRLDLTSDEGFSSSPWGELKEWTQFQYNNYDFGPGNAETYGGCYRAIFRANQVITNVPKIDFDSKAKNEVLGQAYFLRALYYYNLSVLWGSSTKSLPILLEPTNPGNQPEGHTETEVFNQAIDDLTKAIAVLPESWSDKGKGRVTKGAALALRAKCYMQMHKWAEAKTDLSWLVDGAGAGFYSLASNYADNFSKDTENNMESVFEIQYSDTNIAPAGDGDFDTDPNLGQNRGQFFAPPGIGWTDGEMRPWIITEFKKENDLSGKFDIRLKQTAFYKGMEKDFANNDKIYRIKSDDALWAQGHWNNRAFFRKYGSDGYRDFENYYNPVNIRLIRYADVLLMYAECIAETGGSIPVAAALVDRVRARANMPKLIVNYNTALQSKGAFLKRLQMERTLELASEGHRWPDLKRWGLLNTQAGIDELKTRDTDFANFNIGRHSSLPIPSTEKNNNPNIQQNPNY